MEADKKREWADVEMRVQHRKTEAEKAEQEQFENRDPHIPVDLHSFLYSQILVDWHPVSNLIRVTRKCSYDLFNMIL